MVDVRLNNSYALKLYMFNPGDEWYLHYDHFPVPREKAVSIDAGTRYVIVDLKTKNRKDVYGAEVGNCTDLEDYSETSNPINKISLVWLPTQYISAGVSKTRIIVKMILTNTQ